MSHVLAAPGSASSRPQGHPNSDVGSRCGGEAGGTVVFYRELVDFDAVGDCGTAFFNSIFSNRMIALYTVVTALCY